MARSRSSIVRRQASSPPAASCSVDATMSVNSTVASTRSWVARASGSRRTVRSRPGPERSRPKKKGGLAAGQLDESCRGDLGCRRAPLLDVNRAALAAVEYQGRRLYSWQHGFHVDVSRKLELLD